MLMLVGFALSREIPISQSPVTVPEKLIEKLTEYRPAELLVAVRIPLTLSKVQSDDLSAVLRDVNPVIVVHPETA